MKQIIFFLLLISIAAPAFSQSHQITGRIIDEDIIDVRGCLITNLKTGQEVQTDTSGFYHINASINDTLTYNNLGWVIEKRVVKKNTNHINVVLVAQMFDQYLIKPTKSQIKKDAEKKVKFYKQLESKAEKSGKWNY